MTSKNDGKWQLSGTKVQNILEQLGDSVGSFNTNPAGDKLNKGCYSQLAIECLLALGLYNNI